MKKTTLTVALLGIAVFAMLAGVSRCHADGYQYEARGKRDPFVPLIGQGGKSSAAVSLEDAVTIADIKLEGIASVAKGRRAAILNGEIVKEGVRVGLVQVVTIDSKSVSLLVGGKEYVLNLFEEGGTKGE